MPKTKSPRIIMRIDLLLDAKGVYEAIPDQWGMTQVSVTSRLVEWFCRRPIDVQAQVLNHLPEQKKGDVVRAIVKKMAG